MDVFWHFTQPGCGVHKMQPKLVRMQRSQSDQSSLSSSGRRPGVDEEKCETLLRGSPQEFQVRARKAGGSLLQVDQPPAAEAARFHAESSVSPPLNSQVRDRNVVERAEQHVRGFQAEPLIGASGASAIHSTTPRLRPRST